jgi:hypothetical protein
MTLGAPLGPRHLEQVGRGRGIQPSCLAVPRSSRLAQCSAIRPYSMRSQAVPSVTAWKAAPGTASRASPHASAALRSPRPFRAPVSGQPRFVHVPAAMPSPGIRASPDARTYFAKIPPRSRCMAGGLPGGEAVAGLGVRILAEGEDLGRGDSEDQA